MCFDLDSRPPVPPIAGAAVSSFFGRKQGGFAEASDDAWRRTLAFVEEHAQGT